MSFECLDGQSGFSPLAQIVHCFYQPVREYPDAPQAPLSEPAPVGEQAVHIDLKRHLFEEGAQRRGKFLALSFVIQMVAMKGQIARSPCSLRIQMTTVVQIKIAYQHMQYIRFLSKRLQPIKLGCGFVWCIDIHQMLRLIHKHHLHTQQSDVSQDTFRFSLR